MKFFKKSLYILVFMSFALISNYLLGQEMSKDSLPQDVELYFIKEKIHQSPDSLYFNVLKIDNKTTGAITGNLKIIIPEFFKLIAIPTESHTIPAGESIYIPLRISIPRDVIGNQTYIINADFKYKEKNYSENNYISIPAKRGWDMFIDNKNIFFNEFKQTVNLKIKLKNRGNTNEIIKLEFKIGKLLEIMEFDNIKNFTYIDIPANTDSTIIYKVKYNSKLGSNEERILNQIWKESAIQVRSSTNFYQRTDKAYFNRLESRYENIKDQRATPLNIDVQFLNLLSNSPARFNTTVFGLILLPQQREISYQFTGRNFMFTSFNDQNITLARNTYFNVRYIDKDKIIEIGDNMGGNSLHGIPGRGIKAHYTLDKNNSFSLLATQGRFNPDYGASIHYYRKLNNSLSLNTGLTYEDNNAIDYNAFSYLLGGSYSFLKHHTVGLTLMATQTKFISLNDYSWANTNDTTTIGYAYSAFYALNFKDIRFRITNVSTIYNYIRNSNVSRWGAYGDYKINENMNVNLVFDRYKMFQTRYPLKFYQSPSYNINQVGRATFGYSRNRNIYYQIGPIFNSILQNKYNSNTGFTSNFINNNYGLYGSTRFKLSNEKSITPYAIFGLLNASYTSDDTLIEPITLRFEKNIRVGINYYSKYWRLTVFYLNGPMNISMQQLMYEGEMINSESIQVRPQFEKYFNNRTIKFSAYANYIYRMPSGRENINLNTSLHFFLKKGWTFYLSNNIYSITRDDEKYGRITNRIFNLFVGVRKSFDLPQPRLKYYDLDLVFFHDINGNKIKDENEPPIPNIMLTLQRDRNIEQIKTNFIEKSLISNPDGVITYKNLPEGKYIINLLPLENLKDLYILNGDVQEIDVSEDKTRMIPLVESFKIQGKIVINRDENSSEGKVDIEGIRVTAVSPDGDTYAVLSDKFGYFILSIPQAGIYSVKINNVLDEHYILEKDEYEVNFNGVKSIIIDFIFNEKKREINFNGNNLYDFESIDNNNTE